MDDQTSQQCYSQVLTQPSKFSYHLPYISYELLNKSFHFVNLWVWKAAMGFLGNLAHIHNHRNCVISKKLQWREKQRRVLTLTHPSALTILTMVVIIGNLFHSWGLSWHLPAVITNLCQIGFHFSVSPAEVSQYKCGKKFSQFEVNTFSMLSTILWVMGCLHKSVVMAATACKMLKWCPWCYEEQYCSNPTGN